MKEESDSFPTPSATLETSTAIQIELTPAPQLMAAAAAPAIFSTSSRRMLIEVTNSIKHLSRFRCQVVHLA